MKRPDGFLLTISTIVLSAGVIYYHMLHSPAYVENDPVLNAMVERKISLNSLQKKINNIKNATPIERHPAAIRGGEIEFVIESKADAARLAKKYYDEARLKCYQPGAEVTCVEKIENIVTHFPDTLWAGESLVLLTDFYYRTQRMQNAREILSILKANFKDHAEIRSKVSVIEKVIK